MKSVPFDEPLSFFTSKLYSTGTFKNALLRVINLFPEINESSKVIVKLLSTDGYNIEHWYMWPYRSDHML